jgi:hypothetical protein
VEHILANLKNGLTVTFCRWDDRDAQNKHCDRYPHEDWQIGYVRRLKAFAAQSNGG